MRRASTKAFDEHITHFLYNAKCFVGMEKILDSLVINWDQTGIQYIPVSSWAMEKEGAKRVEITGLKDK